MTGTTEQKILEALRLKQGLFSKEDQGLMAKEVAEQVGLSLSEAQQVLNDMAGRGLVHRSSFFWHAGSDPTMGSAE